MKAPLRLSLLCVLFLGLLPSSCNRGGCDNPSEYKLDLNDLILQLGGSGLKAGIPATVDPQGEFLIHVYLSGKPYAVTNFSPETPLFTQTLMATDPCQTNFCSGFYEEIDSFTIFCDTVFQGLAAGLSLNLYFDALYININNPAWTEISVAMAEFNKSLSKDPLLLVSRDGARPFKIKPNVTIETGNYRFTVTMLLKDGTLISKESDRVHFE